MAAGVVALAEELAVFFGGEGGGVEAVGGAEVELLAEQDGGGGGGGHFHGIVRGEVPAEGVEVWQGEGAEEDGEEEDRVVGEVGLR